MNNSSSITSVSTAIAGLILVAYGLAFILGVAFGA